MKVGLETHHSLSRKRAARLPCVSTDQGRGVLTQRYFFFVDSAVPVRATTRTARTRIYSIGLAAFILDSTRVQVPVSTVILFENQTRFEKSVKAFFARHAFSA